MEGDPIRHQETHGSELPFTWLYQARASVAAVVFWHSGITNRLAAMT